MEDTDTTEAAAQLIEVSLGVVMVDPSTVDAGEAFTATVLGSAFERGAEVFIGGIEGQATARDENTLSVDMPALSEGSWDVEVMNPDGTRAVLRSGLTARSTTLSCAHLRVHFDLDSSELGVPEQDALTENLDCWNSADGAIRVEGHCDERGPTDYNVALGERRANTVQRFLATRGVAKSRISTVSYGEEKPLVNGGGDSAWSENRRAEIYLAD